VASDGNTDTIGVEQDETTIYKQQWQVQRYSHLDWFGLQKEYRANETRLP
jgi:hypothetical protein